MRAGRGLHESPGLDLQPHPARLVTATGWLGRVLGVAVFASAADLNAPTIHSPGLLLVRSMFVVYLVSAVAA